MYWRSDVRCRCSWLRRSATSNSSTRAASDRLPGGGAEQMHHQVERRDAAAARIAVAIDFIEAVRDRQARKLLDERVLVFPVDRASIAVQEPRAREKVAARVEAAERHAVTRLQAQPVEHRADALARNRIRTDDEDRIECAAVGHRGIGDDADAVARTRDFVVDADQLVLVDLASDDHVRDAQRIDGRGERDQREVVEQQEAVARHAQVVHAIGRRRGVGRLRHGGTCRFVQAERFGHSSTAGVGAGWVWSYSRLRRAVFPERSKHRINPRKLSPHRRRRRERALHAEHGRHDRRDGAAVDGTRSRRRSRASEQRDHRISRRADGIHPGRAAGSPTASARGAYSCGRSPTFTLASIACAASTASRR